MYRNSEGKSVVSLDLDVSAMSWEFRFAAKREWKEQPGDFGAYCRAGDDLDTGPCQ